MYKENKRKRTQEERPEENDFYEESDLSLGDLSSSDLESVNYKRKTRNNTRKSSSGDDPQLRLIYPKDHESDIDETGEKKTDEYGRLFDGREYKVPVFSLPTRGKTLFMFTKDPAAILGFRDSFVFIKRNPTLVKVQMNNSERGHLVDSNQLKPSFRTRELNVVTARSVYKKFGHRIIKNGVRGRDDYYYTDQVIERPIKKANPIVKSPPINQTQNIASSPITNPVVSTTGKNSLQCELAIDTHPLHKVHIAAVNALQFNRTLNSFRQINPTHYDLLTNVYQISKNKQSASRQK